MRHKTKRDCKQQLSVEDAYYLGRSDERVRILEHQTVIYDLEGIGHRVVLVKDIKEMENGRD